MSEQEKLNAYSEYAINWLEHEREAGASPSFEEDYPEIIEVYLATIEQD